MNRTTLCQSFRSWPLLLVTLMLLSSLLPVQTASIHAAEQVIFTTPNAIIQTSVAPDQRHILVVDRIFTGETQVSIIDITSKEQQILTTLEIEYYIDKIVWSSDSNWLGLQIGQYSYYSPGYTYIKAFEVHGSNAYEFGRISPQCSPSFFRCSLNLIGFSQDNQGIIYSIRSEGSTSMYRSSLINPDSEGTKLNPEGTFAENCIQSPDMYWIACIWPQNANKLFIAPTNGSSTQAKTYTTPNNTPIYKVEFTPNSKHLLALGTTVEPPSEYYGKLFSITVDDTPSVVDLSPQGIQLNVFQTMPYYTIDIAITPDSQFVLARDPDGLVRIPVYGPIAEKQIIAPNYSNTQINYTERFGISSDGQHVLISRRENWVAVGSLYNPDLLGFFKASINSIGSQSQRILKDSPFYWYVSDNNKYIIYWDDYYQYTAHYVSIDDPPSNPSILGIYDPWPVQTYGRYSLLQSYSSLAMVTDNLNTTGIKIFTYDEYDYIQSSKMLSNGSVLVTTYDTITLIDLGILYAGTPQANLCASEQQGRLNIPIQLESMPLATRTISYTVSGGSAQPSDYVLPGTTLSLAAFEQSGSIPLQIIPDQQADDGETIEITLSSGEDIRLTTNTITVTLHDQGSCQAFFPLLRIP